jgi:hypothetical protein
VDAPPLRLGLELVAYELARRPNAVRPRDPIAAVEAALEAARQLPAAGAALCELYEPLLRLAADALVALSSLPEPDEVDGLTSLAGFDQWRRQRQP